MGSLVPLPGLVLGAVLGLVPSEVVLAPNLTALPPEAPFIAILAALLPGVPLSTSTTCSLAAAAKTTTTPTNAVTATISHVYLLLKGSRRKKAADLDERLAVRMVSLFS